MSAVFRLSNPRARAYAEQAVQSAPDNFMVTISEPKRSRDQNNFFHTICRDIERAGKEWAGKPRTKDEWKVLLVSAHSVATKEGTEIVPGLEGEFVNIRESTARMGVRRANSLIEYTLAWCATNGVELVDTRRGGFFDEDRAE